MARHGSDRRVGVSVAYATKPAFNGDPSILGMDGVHLHRPRNDAFLSLSTYQGESSAKENYGNEK
jgi:hypothetical protein